MKARNQIAVLIAAAVLVGSAVWVGIGEELQFAQVDYYIFALGGTAVDVELLFQAATADGYTVIRYEGETTTAQVGDQPTSDPIEVLLASERLLVTDSSRFLLRVTEETYTYAFRSGSSGAELVFSPHADQTMDAVVSVLLDLQRLGVIGSEVDLGFQSYAKAGLKGPEPPEGARIESDLFWLIVAEDWHTFAAAKGISLVGLRAEVVAELLPEAELPDPFVAFVASESESLAKLLLPIDQLVPLALSEGVGLVRQPYDPIAP